MKFFARLSVLFFSLLVLGACVTTNPTGLAILPQDNPLGRTYVLTGPPIADEYKGKTVSVTTLVSVVNDWDNYMGHNVAIMMFNRTDDPLNMRNAVLNGRDIPFKQKEEPCHEVKNCAYVLVVGVQYPSDWLDTEPGPWRLTLDSDLGPIVIDFSAEYIHSFVRDIRVIQGIVAKDGHKAIPVSTSSLLKHQGQLSDIERRYFGN